MWFWEIEINLDAPLVILKPGSLIDWKPRLFLLGKRLAR